MADINNERSDFSVPWRGTLMVMVPRGIKGTWIRKATFQPQVHRSTLPGGRLVRSRRYWLYWLGLGIRHVSGGGRTEIAVSSMNCHGKSMKRRVACTSLVTKKFVAVKTPPSLQLFDLATLPIPS